MSRNGSDGKMQVHRDGADARAEKLTVSVFIALGKVLALWLCCIVSQLHCVSGDSRYGPDALVAKQ